MSRALRLDNGTGWPDPAAVSEAFDRLPRPAAADRDIGEPMTEDERRALLDYWTIREVVSAYWHLAAHPAGTESTVQTLRSLRRAVAARRRE